MQKTNVTEIVRDIYYKDENLKEDPDFAAHFFEHSKRVGDLCYQIANHLGKPESYCSAARNTGILHDIGKVAILDMKPDIFIYRKSPTPEEKTVMDTHPVVGSQGLDSVVDLGFDDTQLAMQGTLLHHRWYNGQGGYPNDKRLFADIPPIARILSIADCYDAIRTRPCNGYMSPLKEEEARKELWGKAGKQFDKGIVEIFLGGLDRDAQSVTLIR